MISNYLKEIYRFSDSSSYQIEISSACNQVCRMCYGQRFSLYPKKFIEYNKFIQILDTLNPTYIKLWGRGETLIHPRINDILTELKNRKIRVSLTTNLNVDIDFDLLESSVSDVFVSLHSFEEETYKKITGEDNSKVLQNILELKKRNIRFLLKMIISKYNESEISQFSYLCRKLNVPSLFSGVDFPVHELSTDLRDQMIDELNPVSTAAEKYSRYNSNLEYKNYSTCRIPESPSILIDGSVYSCCMYPEEGYLGNIFDAGFSLNRELLEKMKKRDSDACKTCPLC